MVFWVFFFFYKQTLKQFTSFLKYILLLEKLNQVLFGFESCMLLVVFHAIQQAKKNILLVFFFFVFSLLLFSGGQERCHFKGTVIKECIFATWTSWNWKNHNCGGNYLARSEKRIKDSCMCCFKHCCRQHCWATCSSQVCWFPNVWVSKLKFGI